MPELQPDFRQSAPGIGRTGGHLQTGLPQVIVAMITSQMTRAGHPSRVAVLLSTPAGQQSGLLSDSVVVTDNLATITDSAISRVIGTLPMADVDQALRHTLNLP